MLLDGEDMTLKEAIKKADFLRPNTVYEEIKAHWVMGLEVEIAELMHVDIPECMWPEDQDLLMPFPKDDIYALNLMAKIDLANEETELYANDSVTANQATTEAKQWWYRNFGNPEKKYVRV